MNAPVDPARAAYDTAVAALMGCRGLFAAPRTEAKLKLLRERLDTAGAELARCYELITEAYPETPFIAPVIGTMTIDGQLATIVVSDNVADLGERRSRRAKARVR